jgi:hypothetical protein
MEELAAAFAAAGVPGAFHEAGELLRKSVDVRVCPPEFKTQIESLQFA